MFQDNKNSHLRLFVEEKNKGAGAPEQGETGWVLVQVSLKHKKMGWPLFSVPEAKTGKLGEGKVAGPREGAEAKGFHGVLTRED